MSKLNDIYELTKKKDPTDAGVKKMPATVRRTIYPRTMTDVSVMAEAQRIFNPSLPPTIPKPPNAKQMEAGTTSALDIGGSWGTPERVNG